MKFFEIEARFPRAPDEVPPPVSYVAEQVLLDWALACAEARAGDGLGGQLRAPLRLSADVVVAEALVAGARAPVLGLALAALAAGIVPASLYGFDYPDPAQQAATARKVAWWSGNCPKPPTCSHECHRPEGRA